MPLRRRRFARTVGLVGAGAFLLAGPSSSCTSFVGEVVLGFTDFCFIFDCQSGVLGGTLQPCADFDLDGNNQGPILNDCP